MIKVSIVTGDSISQNKLYSFLVNMDCEFPTPLSKRTDLMEYSKKLLKKGCVVCAIADEKIVGIIAGYANNYITMRGYAAVLVVDKEYRGNKISSRLLEKFINLCASAGMKTIDLNTYYTNKEAIGLYEKFNFQKKYKSDEGYIYYEKNLEG